MTVKVKKPILIAGVGISFLLWFWQSFATSITQIGEFSFWGLMLIGASLFFVQPKSKTDKIQNNIYKAITKTQLEKVFIDCENNINKLIKEAITGQNLLDDLAKFKASLTRNNLQVAIAGRTKSGKSSLKQILETKNIASEIEFLEVENLDSYEEEKKVIALHKLYLESDLVLFIINGDLTNSEWQLIQQLNIYYQRIILIFNQKDRFLPDEQAIILKQLQERVKTIISPENILAIATAPQDIKVRKYQAKDSFQEWLEKPEPEINQLLNLLQEIFNNQRQPLILGTVYRQVITLQNKAKNLLNKHRKEKALPIIEQYQWLAAGTAFANPVSSLDLLATAAINTQMLVDLSSIYQHKLSLEKAKTASITIGKLMVKLGIVEFSTQTIGSILKTNIITYIAGGLVQGISAAYLTRIAGLSLIEYFELEETSNSETLNIRKLKQKIQTIFTENRRDIFLQNFVKTAVSKL